MDFWYRNPLKSEVIGRCGGDGKNRMIKQNRQKSNAKKKKKRRTNDTTLVTCANVKFTNVQMN